jgi:hypothetical protein
VILPPAGNAGHCFTALGYLLRATNAEVRQWLIAKRGVRLTTGQIGASMYWLAHAALPLVELAEREPFGSGRPGVWQLTARGRAVFVDEYNRSTKDWRVMQ